MRTRLLSSLRVLRHARSIISTYLVMWQLRTVNRKPAFDGIDAASTTGRSSEHEIFVAPNLHSTLHQSCIFTTSSVGTYAHENNRPMNSSQKRTRIPRVHSKLCSQSSRLRNSVSPTSPTRLQYTRQTRRPPQGLEICDGPCLCYTT